MKRILFVLMLLSTSLFAQKQVNNYKYVIVANKFDFVNKVDKFQTSSLTNFLFNKYGFTAYLSGEKLPEDVEKNRCLALFGSVRTISSLFTTKTIVELRDCTGQIVYSSKEGKSKLKDYKKAYHEAIRNSFESIQKLKYKYTPVLDNSIKKRVEETKKTEKTITVEKVKIINEHSKNLGNLYAQPIKNGFQLVDTKPEVVFQILKTNLKDVFILKNKNGVLYKNKDSWIAEFYENGIKHTENYHIKF